MPRCFLESCGNYYEKTRFSKHVIYHMLPADKTLIAKWLKVCGKTSDEVPYYARICSEHFSDECYQRDMQHELLGLPLRRKLKVDAFPDRNLPKKGAKTIKESEEVEDRKLRHKSQSLLRKNVDQIEHNDRIREKVSKQIIKESISGKTIQISPDILSEIEKQTNNQRQVENEQANKDKNKEFTNFLIDSTDNPTMSRNKSVHRQIISKRLKKLTPPGEPITNSPGTGKQKNNDRQVENEQAKEDKNKELANFSFDSTDNPTMSRTRSVHRQIIIPKRVKKLTPPGETITNLPRIQLISKNSVKSKKIFDFKKPINDGMSKEKEDKGKINNKLYKPPMRSSYRIAKKKSIELLSDSFTEKVNQPSNRPANFSDKLKFMAKLQLKFERTENVLVAITEAEESLDETMTETKELSRHFSAASYERDVQHELLGLPTRCRLKRGAIPDKNLPSDFLKEDVQAKSAIAVLLAVGLVPRKKIEGLSKDLDKMQIMENVGEGCDVNPPSSPGHADEHQNNEGPLEDAPVKYDEPSENDDSFEIKIENNGLENQPEDIKEEKDDAKKSDDEVEEKHQEENSSHSSSSEPPSNKRKLDYDSPPMKRLKTDIEDNFMAREKIIGDYFEVAACNNLEQIQSFSDQVLSEIKTLNELAKEKEQEWNQLLHMKKLKEELLLRLQRKRQVLIFNDSDLNDIQPETNGQQSLQKCNQKANMLRELRAANLEKLKRRTSLLNNAYNKQKPVVDVQSIIADYRQSHPESVPRRGGSLIGPKSGLDHCDMPSQNGTQDDSRVSSNQNSHNRPSGEIKTYKDILLQCARLSQAEKTELQMQLNASKLPPPYPEVTVHPVTSTSSVAPTNSLLHGILTKTPNRQKTNGKTKVNGGKSSFSPTLARLLTAPDRSATSTPTNMMSGSLLNASNIALSAIFPGSKVRNEITITPVGSEFETPIKRELMEDESEDPVDRLVIDETLDSSNLRKEDNKSEDGEDVPQCQGCNQRAAQFVCAGCGNQWYCSRDCQVTAWDDHSEVCSG